MKINIFQAGLLALLLLPACKKDEDTVTKPSLSGLTITSAAPYVRAGAVLSFTADVSALTDSDEDNDPEYIGLAWQVNSEKRDTLTMDIRKSNPVFQYTVSTEGSYSVVCYAFTDGSFYSTSATSTFKAIDPDTALEGLSSQTVTDRLGQTWTNRNLYQTATGRTYEDCEVVASVFGRYYNWEQAQTACPAGWHLPAPRDFDEGLTDVAGDLMADASFLGEKMWDYWPQVTITNALQFNALPVGYIDLAGSGSASTTRGDYAIWWTSGEEDGQGIYRYLFEQNPRLQAGSGSKTSLYLSVRCVKD